MNFIARGTLAVASCVLIAGLLAACAAPPPPPPIPAPIVVAPPPPEPPKKPAPPVAALRPVTESFFGQRIIDPYRHLEDVKHPEMVAYLRAQGEFARKALDALPGRKAMLDRIRALSESTIAISGVQVVGEGANPRVF